jgi:hypothetical protein
MALRPVRTGVLTAGGDLAASFDRSPLGAPVATAALMGPHTGRFRLGLAIGRLKPGTYRLEVRASEPGTSLGSLRLTRRISIS